MKKTIGKQNQVKNWHEGLLPENLEKLQKQQNRNTGIKARGFCQKGLSRKTEKQKNRNTEKTGLRARGFYQEGLSRKTEKQKSRKTEKLASGPGASTRKDCLEKQKTEQQKNIRTSIRCFYLGASYIYIYIERDRDPLYR